MSWVSKNMEVVETVLENGAVLLNLETKFYYSLNGIGYRIWELLDTTNSLNELFQKLLDEYDTSLENIQENISSFLMSLREEHLLTASHSSIKISDGSLQSEENDKSNKKHYLDPEIIKHEEPLHEVVQNPFDPQLPLAE